MASLIRSSTLGPSFTPARPRIDLVLFALLLLLPAAGVAGWLWSRCQTSAVEAELLERANELVSRVSQREPHLPSPPGTAPSGTALARNLDTLLAALALDEKSDEALRRAGRGELDPAALPPEASAALERARPLIAEPLAETRSPEVRLPAGIRLNHPEGGLYSAPILRRLSAAIALEIFGAIGAGEGDRALALCLDGLALGRDLSLGAALFGQSARRAMQSELAAACRASITAASPEAAGRGAAAFGIISETAPPLSATVRDDATLMMAEVFGTSLSESFQRSLPKGLPPMAPPDPSALQRWLRRDAVRDVWAVFEDVERAMEAPPSEREKAFAAAGRRAERRVNPTAAIILIDWGKRASLDAEARALLVALASDATARARVELSPPAGRAPTPPRPRPRAR